MSVPGSTVQAVRNRMALADDDASLLSDEQIVRAIGAAVVTYSRDRPSVLVAALSGDGTAYEFALPAGWVWGFSTVVSVEYPAGERPAQFVDASDYSVVERPGSPDPVRLLRFETITPASGAGNISLTYTGRHRHTTGTSTIVADDHEALVWLAASLAAETLAAKFAASSDATIAADAVNHRDGESRWRSVARTFRARYDEHMGKGGTVAPAGTVVDWDANLDYGMDRLFHRRRWR